MKTTDDKAVFKIEGKIPRVLLGACRKHQNRITRVEHDEDGYWVHLRSPWFNPVNETRAIHETTAVDAALQLNDLIVKP